MAQKDGFDEGADGVFLIVVEAVEGFEVERAVVIGAAIALAEQERVCAGVKREGEVVQDVDGGFAVAAFEATDLGDVHAAALGEDLQGDCAVFAEGVEADRDVGVRHGLASSAVERDGLRREHRSVLRTALR